MAAGRDACRYAKHVDSSTAQKFVTACGSGRGPRKGFGHATEVGISADDRRRRADDGRGQIGTEAVGKD